MLQPLTPAAGSKVGRYSLAAEAPEGLSAPSFVGKSEDGQLARVLLLPRAGVDAAAVQRAVGQARSLTHANVLRPLEAEPVEGRLALSLEHVEGASLQTLITAAGNDGLARNVAVRIALDVLEGLAASHAAGHAHGELGPHLVFVGTDGQARIIGAGVAKVLGKALAPKTTSDRLAYVAPERVKVASTGNAPAVDPKSDVFSAAVLVWELLSHQRLFAGRLESAVIQKVLTAPVAPLASSMDDLPDGVDELLKKALERDPSRRTATARELADGLAAAFEGAVASHEEVARAVDSMAKKTIEELRARVEKASTNGAAAANGTGAAVAVPPARASFPTLDDSWIESVEEAPKPAARPRIGVPPKPPPKPPTRTATPKPGEVKAPEIKIAAPAKAADDKSAEAKADEKAAEAKADDKAAEVKADEKAAETKADEKAAEVKADEKAAGEKATEAKAADDKPAETPDPKAAATRPALPKAPLKRGNISLPTPGSKRPLESPRKGTLLGVAPPMPRADAAKAPESEKAVTTARSPATPDVAPADAAPGAEAAADAAKDAEAPKSAPASRTQLSGVAPAAAKPADGEAPASAPASPQDKKRRAMPGNLQPGDTLGRYELLLPVAAGGMAAVWAARLQGTAGFQKIVAIKTMLPGLSADQDFEEMFLDEARVAARIRHPNVVEIFDLGEEDETLYLVMEWVEGETLGSLQKGAKTHGGIPLPILLRIASQACAGLHAAHELRDDKGALVDLVHRDISPANILVSRTGFVKIVDFGVAKSKARMYTTRVGGMLKGKTPYLSPEQLAGQTIDRRSDLFSFGAVLYVLATGLHPFRGETEAKTIENIALRDPVPLRKIDPNIDAELEAIVLKALEKDRDQRYQSASEMQRAIDTLAASIGPAVNDDDVASFLKTVAGDGLEKRAGALRDAIATADIGKVAPLSRREMASEAKIEASAADDAAKGDAGAGDDAAKVEIDDVELDVDDGAKAKAAEPSGAEAGDAAADAQDPALNAPSLGSDGERVSPPDTLAAASTEPSEQEATPNRRRGALYAVGGIVGLCALIGVIALAQSSGDPHAGQGKGADTTAAPARTGVADVAPTPAETASAAPSTTEAPAASAEPSSTAAEPSAEPEPSAAPETTSAPEASAAPQATSTPPTAKTTPVTRPVTRPVTKPVTRPTVKKPPPKFEPNTL